MLRYTILGPEKMGGYQDELADLESSISYPLEGGDDSFTIRHGESYHRFFSDMGESYFMIARSNERICGTIAGVIKKTALGSNHIRALYVADLKLRADIRGKGVPRKMLFQAFRAYISSGRYRGWRFLFFAGMHGERGNVTKSFSGTHLGRLAVKLSVHSIYIVKPERLEFEEVPSHDLDPERELELSPDKVGKITLNSGTKDLYRSSDGSKMLLAHIHPDSSKGFISDLTRLSKRVREELPGHLACFSVDNNREDIISYLSESGLNTNTLCSVYAFRWPLIGPSFSNIERVSISTSEI